MPQDSILSEVARRGVVPVITIEAVAAALPLADALLDGGLPLAEITFRTPAAAAVIEQIAKHRPEVLVGAGTVLSAENLHAAKAAGAKFAVAPGLNPAVVRGAAECGLPFVPGVCTPSEIEHALELGCRVLKFFPAQACGGVETILALAAPYAHTGVRFVPTGGVHAGNLEAYLSLACVAAVGGTWIARPDDINAGRWDVIRDRCRQAAAIVCRVRGGGE